MTLLTAVSDGIEVEDMLFHKVGGARDHAPEGQAGGGVKRGSEINRQAGRKRFLCRVSRRP